ncbi:MAG TPA: ATP-dependent helicase [Acidimicrobiales bacterium]
MRWERSQLNPEQREAVQHDDRPLLVLAGAGTGKTATLAARLAHLLERGAEPERVCLLTFSRRAAAEMRARAGHMIDPALAARVVGGTFHSVAQRLLRHHGRLIGLDPSFSVLDGADSTELIGLVRSESGACEQGGARFPRKETLAAILSRVANAQVRLSEVVSRSFPWCSQDLEAMRAVFAAYTSRKRAQQLCDFDDLLLLVRALGGSEVGRGVLSGRFDHVLVDEYQDVNALQADLVELLRPRGCGVTAVGDDAQAIYGFRAASTVAILDFPRRYADTVVVRLEHNYRSTTPILAVANQVMADEPGGGSVKALWSERPGRRRPLLRTCADEATQADSVCASVLSHREDGVALRSQAVLFRAGHHSATLEVALGRRRIPYVKYGGLRFVEAAHVKDLLSLLRLLDNPWDEMAWFRVLRLLEGVGPATAGRVLGQLGVRRSDVSADPAATSPLTRLLAAAPAVPGPAREDLAGLRAALAECNGAAPVVDAAPPVGAQIDRLRQWLAPVVMRRYDAPAARCGDLERLAEQAAAASSRGAFVSELTLDPPVVTGDLAGPPSLDDDWLVLSTVHSAKGGEWDVVHVIHAADGMFPSDLATGDEDALAEERRLFYVAVTRARNALEVNVPLRYHRHRHRLDDRHDYAPVSRFLSPVVQSLMDVETAVPPSGDLPTNAVVSDPAAGVAAVDRLLADLWS